MWKERLGFARMAIAHGCTIVPFAAVGVEHAYDILLDADEIMASPVGKLLTRLGVALPTAGYQRDASDEACPGARAGADPGALLPASTAALT